ncbi:MAG: TonB-dependent receptor [Parasphingorhabdus sp.]|nr:TonB-dependent receptor [Parasphingorhabdus sp.]
MSKLIALKGFLLLTTALALPAIASAQAADTQASDDVQADQTPTDPTGDPNEDDTDISIPGASIDNTIVVTGRRNNDISRITPEVVSVLSSADIARTGEGDIAGALGRVTGLSVVGNGFVFVRGLGDRYSLALLNGSPLPSPEPLKRVVPLDIFPTNIIASTLVQKSYSVNFPGEFGGGVINLTTKSVPRDPYLTFSGSLEADSETTGHLGYTYYGSEFDSTGFDDGTRDLPPALREYVAGNIPLSDPRNTSGPLIASQLINGRNSVLQRNRNLPPNSSFGINGGTSFAVADADVGFIFSLGYKNKWRTRDTLQQTANAADLSSTENNFQRVITDERTVVNALVGYGLEFGENKIRWTNVYIRDTLKQARLGVGQRQTGSPIATLLQQDTAWFERQLLDTQLVGEFKFDNGFSLDARAVYANSRREAPDEISFEYFRSNLAGDPFGQLFINRLDNGQQGNASASYSNLKEDLFSAGADLSYEFTSDVTGTVGYAFSDAQRRSERRDFLFTANPRLPQAVATFRPDLLLQPVIINFYNVILNDTNEQTPVFDARLRNHAGYVQLNADFTDSLSLNIGVRYETAKQSVSTPQIFPRQIGTALPTTNLDRDYWLPAATLTYQLNPDMQIRLNASKTIARPQFRELIFQAFFDPDSNRQFRGNPLLTDSQLYNAEARYEWYFDRGQKLAVAGFYKRIDNPIETFSSFTDNSVVTSFANAPTANLYGVEVELQKYFEPFADSDSSFLASRRVVLIGNYTFTKSKIKVQAGDPAAVFSLASANALDFFRDGAALTGQSDHIANVQFGFEDQDRLSQQTILLSYASNRVTSRGATGQPDIVEKPGFTLDFVAREGFELGGLKGEVKFEARNLTQTKYQEFQQLGENIIFYNRYTQGTTVSFGVDLNF